MGSLVIAGSASLVAAGETAFAEAALASASTMTYSDLLSSDDSAAIDREAYSLARTWYRSQGAGDPTLLGDASLGRAYELRATAMLLAYLRARMVLSRLIDRQGAIAVEIRKAGEEWALAAESLGLRVDAASRITRPLISIIPDHEVQKSSTQDRLLGWLARRLLPTRSQILVSGAPGGAAYVGALLRAWPTQMVNPSPRVQVAALLRRWRMHPTWLGDAVPDSAAIKAVAIPEPSDSALVMLRSRFLTDLPNLAAWAHIGRASRAAVAVAAQDVSPSVRSLLLGFKAAGGRVIALEHGIGGGYAEQVHTVANELGVWGQPQADYHRQAGPASMEIVQIGWPRLEDAWASFSDRVSPAFDVVYFGQPAAPFSAGGWAEDVLHAHAMVEEYATRHLDRRVAVKDHPVTRAYHGSIVPHAYAKSATGDSLSIIRHARVVAVTRSTTGLEAMAIGRPVISVATRGYIGPANFIHDSGAVARVASSDEFDAAAEELLGNTQAYERAVQAGREYAASFVVGIDRRGSARDRLLALVGAAL